MAVHAALLARFGGLNGIRDDGLLESALNRPRQLLNYGEPDLFDVAAAYAEGIVKNHPFLDGNKRSALMAAALFLETNGIVFTAPEEEAVLWTVALAAGVEDVETFASWMRDSCVPRPGPET
jgi:death-on-curing protein